MITFLILIFIIIIILLSMHLSEVKSRWDHHLDEFQFSSEEFHKAVEASIKGLGSLALGGANTFFEGSVVPIGGHISRPQTEVILLTFGQRHVAEASSFPGGCENLKVPSSYCLLDSCLQRSENVILPEF